MNLSSKFLLPLAACALMASCANENEQEMPVTQGKVMFQVPDFVEEEDSRIAVNVNSDGAQFTWTEGDTLGVFPDEGFQTAFPISDGSGTSAAEFDGGKWALRSNAEYAAYYPFMHPMDAIDKANIAVAYTGQCQSGNNSTAHLGDYDFLAAPFTEVSASGNTTFNLAHIGALVRFQLKVPSVDNFSKLTLKSDGAPFVTSGTIDLTATNPTLTPTATSNYMTLYLSNVSSDEADDLITLYMMMAPADQSSAQISVWLSGSKNYTGSMSGKNMLPGTIYGYSLELEETNNHDYVDLGLPSNTLWATCNVGATNPEEAGDYFAWGETAPKDLYIFQNYKWNSAGDPPVLSKYCTDETQGTVDGLTELDLADDAAYVNMGADWCMPTAEQCRELINTSYTRCEWERVNGVYGRKITSLTNGNSIFIPAAGHRVGDAAAFNEGDLLYGLYWSSTLLEDNSLNACFLALSSGSVAVPTVGGTRMLGRTIRAVRIMKRK